MEFLPWKSANNSVIETKAASEWIGTKRLLVSAPLVTFMIPVKTYLWTGYQLLVGLFIRFDIGIAQKVCRFICLALYDKS